MGAFCTKCGSTNHRAFDCSRPDQALKPPVREQDPAPASPNAPAATQEPARPALEASPEVLPALLPPRRPGWPPVCSAENLPAFPDGKKSVAEYVDRWAPRADVSQVWKCGSCGLWHFRCRSHGPSQDGAERKPLPRGFAPFRGRRAARLAHDSPQPDLPKREVAEKKPDSARNAASPKRQTPGQATMF